MHNHTNPIRTIGGGIEGTRKKDHIGFRDRIATLAIHKPHAILAQSQNPDAIEEHTAGEYRTREASWAVRSPIAGVFQDCNRTEETRRRECLPESTTQPHYLCKP